MNKITLNYQNTELIILPALGGRIVSACFAGRKSVLKSDEKEWDGANKPELNFESDFYGFNGHINWVGPQSAWWTRQDENLQRKQEAAPWPPDPFLIYGEYTVSYETERSVVLEGPASPVSGVRFIKEIGINEDGAVFLKTTIENTSNSPVDWDIWFNSRMDGYSQVYVPVANKENCRTEHVLNDKSDMMPFTLSAGFFSYLPIVPEGNFSERSSKTFIYPEKPYMAAFTSDSLIVYQFEMYPVKEIHPEQALVEIYNHTEREEKVALLEMEYHSPMFHLLPGERAEAFEIWHILPYDGGDSRLEQLDFLDDVANTLAL